MEPWSERDHMIYNAWSFVVGVCATCATVFIVVRFIKFAWEW